MRVVILAGGMGTRLAEETTVRPKPMIEIGGRPILWHIMRWYAHYGFTEFVIALGYKGEQIKEYFLNYYTLNSDITVSLKGDKLITHSHEVDDWTVHLVDTGIATQTGGRLRRLKEWLPDNTFMMTYGDGVSDVNLHALLAFHQSHGKLATVTAVRPPARFGSLVLDDDSVTEFVEKPLTGQGWINGGFFVLDRAVLDYIQGDDVLWEHGPLESLARDSQLKAYRHDGFWQPMDTIRDRQILEELWHSNRTPWKVSK